MSSLGPLTRACPGDATGPCGPDVYMGVCLPSWRWLAFLCWENSGDPSLSPIPVTLSAPPRSGVTEPLPPPRSDPLPQSCPLTLGSNSGRPFGLLQGLGVSVTPSLFLFIFPELFSDSPSLVCGNASF